MEDKLIIRIREVSWVFCACVLSALAASANEATEYKRTGKEALQGLFFGIGVDQSSSIEKMTCIKQTYTIMSLRGRIPPLPALNPKSEQQLIDWIHNRISIRTISSASDIKTDPGGFITSLEAHDYTAKPITSGQNNKMGGSLLVGYGTFFCHNIYCGLELGVDITSNKERFVSAWPMRMKNIKLKQHGVTPSLSARLGFFSDALDAMLYAKAGVTVWNSKLETKVENIRLTKIMPTIGVGIEKKIELIALRCEFDYRLPLNKTSNLSCYDESRGVSVLGTPISIADHTTSIRTHQKGYTVRIIGVMHL